MRKLIQTELKRLHGQERWNTKTMFQSAKSPSDVTVYLEGQTGYHKDLSELCELSINDVNCVKKVKNFSPAFEHVELIDLKLDIYGPAEDQLYAAFPALIKNIRRGNTVIKYRDAKNNLKWTLGRKGLEKFFDLRYEHISPEQRFDDTCLDDETHMHKNYILAGPLKAILDGHRVEVIKTLKANGENVQVSWNPEINSWIICSKNVGLAAQNRSHVAMYQADRFGFAKEMAHVWFDILEKLERDHGRAKLDELVSDLTGNTLIGEYIGSDQHQHLVKYSRVTIIFYAVVSNMSMDDCWPCDQSWAFFTKFGLDKCHAQSLGQFTNYSEMTDALCKVFKDVAKSEIAKDEEGNVLYFIKRAKEGSEKDKVLSLAKLKTLEYRLFRKMREKLRNAYAQKDGSQSDPDKGGICKKFRREAKELSDEHELPRPLEYYCKLFEMAF